MTTNNKQKTTKYYENKYYNEYCQAVINEYQKNHPDNNLATDAIKKDLKLYLIDANFYRGFMLFCAAKEIEIEAEQTTNQEERVMVANIVYKRIYQMLDSEIEELSEDIASNDRLIASSNSFEKTELRNENQGYEIARNVRIAARDAIFEILNNKKRELSR